MLGPVWLWKRSKQERKRRETEKCIVKVVHKAMVNACKKKQQKLGTGKRGTSGGRMKYMV